MPWTRLAAWFSTEELGEPVSLSTLSLVTLTLSADASADEIDFYGDAEVAALMHWAQRGAFVLALTAIGRDELTLLCPSSPRSTRMAVEQLPLVSAGLVDFDIRGVMPLSIRSLSASAEAG